MMNKRVLRKFAIPSSSPNPKNGIFCADQVKYVVRTAIKNIDHQRTLVLYIYAKESVLAGNHTPRWTMFQQKGGYIALCADDKGTRWQQSMFENLGKDYFFRDKCSFYSQADERRVTRYCQSEKQKGFDSLCLFQLELLRKKQRENELKKQRKIIERMKPVGALPRDIKGFMHRETLPHYIFYDYAKGKAPKNAYCTACKHNVSVAEAKHNGEGVCPHCKRKITFKSRGRRGYIVDRSTAQVIQRLGSNEMIIRFVKAYRRYPKSDTPEFHVYENARLFLQWDGSKIIASESYYYGYSRDRITPWHPGDRPVFSRWYYNFEADCCGYLYHRNLDSDLKGTPWQYSALKEYYAGDPTPLYAGQYLQKYLRYPIAICHDELFGTLKIVFRHTSQQLTELRQYTAFVKPKRLILIGHILSLPFPCSDGSCAKVVGLLRTQIPLDTMLLRTWLRRKGVQPAGVRAYGIDRTPIIPQHTAYTAAVDCSQHEYMEAGG